MGRILQRNRIFRYLCVMDHKFKTLQTLYTIVSETAQPESYHCTPRELILHSTFDWELINKHLATLSEEALVVISQADTLQFSITARGIEMVKQFANTAAETPALMVMHETTIKNEP